MIRKHALQRAFLKRPARWFNAKTNLWKRASALWFMTLLAALPSTTFGNSTLNLLKGAGQHSEYAKMKAYYDNFLTTILDGGEFPVTKTSRIVIKDALFHKKESIAKLSPLRTKAEAIETAFFVRLYDDENPAHLAQIFGPFDDMLHGLSSPDSAQVYISMGMRRMHRSFIEAYKLGFLRGVRWDTPEKFAAHLLTAGAETFPEITQMMALAVALMKGEKNEVFNLGKIMLSKPFHNTKTIKLRASHAQRLLARNLDLANVSAGRVLKEYWLIMTETTRGYDEAIQAMTAALGKDLPKGSQQERIDAIKKRPLFKSMLVLSKKDADFKVTMDYILRNLAQETL